MKKFLISGLLAVLTLGVQAQPINPTEKMPVDPDVRIGKLDNGMTYYIRHNAKPAGIGEFHIVHNVGAIQEEDSQMGLAHFLEHLAFNGTKNLPGKQMIEWLESVGVRFGADLNAATSVEMTTYKLSNVPLKRESIVDSALLILHDWSHFITLKDEEIDNERGVIVEEMRQRNSPSVRLQETVWPIFMGGTRYGFRNIIGNENQLRTFPYSELKSFYDTWYLPTNQAIIAIGDFDVDQMEARIKKAMSDIPKPVNPAQKEFFPIPDHVEPVVTIFTDPELTSSSVSLYFKHDAPTWDEQALVITAYNNSLISAATSMLMARMGEIAREPDAPFTSARAVYGKWTSSNSFLELSAGARNSEMIPAFEAALTELERARRFGFTENEWKLMKTNWLTSIENGYASRDDRRSGSWVGAYTDNFTENAQILSAEQNYEMSKRMVEQITVEQISEALAALITPVNRNIIAVAPQKEGIEVPTEQELLDVMARVREKQLEPYSQPTIDKPLVAHEIKAGKVKKTEAGMYGSTVWTLSNGVRVIVKPTDLDKNRVTMSSYARGGVSMISDEDYRTMGMMGAVAGASGLGDFTAIELGRVTAGKTALAEAGVGRFTSGVSGYSVTADIETMLQLAYLQFTAPRFDRAQFDRLMAQTRLGLENSLGTPGVAWQNEATKSLYGDNPRAKGLSLDNIDQIDFDRMADLRKKFFDKTAANYTFYFIGDFDPAVLKPLVEKYLGGLPVDKKIKLASKDDGIERREGALTDIFETKMEMPKTTVLYTYAGDIDYTQENQLTMNILSECLYKRYFRSIREEKGGTYGVSVGGSVSREPKESYTLNIQFDTDPAMMEELTAIVDAELRKIADQGPIQEDVDKVIENILKQRPESLKQNGTWLGYLQTYYIWGEDWEGSWDDNVASMTGAKVQAMAKKIVADGGLIKIIMNPTQE